jgi:imidazole glycerol-phosphate synthase subunit HisH
MPMMDISILDYGLGNIFSINESFKKAGFTTKLISTASEIEKAETVILPGVGAFGKAMESLKENNLINSIKSHVSKNKPLVGICLGMQLLFEESSEHCNIEGLGLIKGKVRKFEPLLGIPMRIPHIGWNEVYGVENENASHLSFLNKQEANYFYFVHSYYVEPKNKVDILLEATYAGVKFCAAVKNKNILGFQFHPENSAQTGQELIKHLPQLFK